MRNQPNRLDDIANVLGWNCEDMGDPSPDEAESHDPLDPLPGSYIDEDYQDCDDFDPYTLHRHPIFIITRGLYQHLTDGLNALVEFESESLDVRLVHLYHKSLNAGEHNAIMAVNALDMGDFNLCICHLKSAVSILNTSLSVLQQFPSHKRKAFAFYVNDATAAIFDLRELWLRVLQECREEHKRGFRE